jgi:Domain of Unknown Function (DUF1080)
MKNPVVISAALLAVALLTFQVTHSCVTRSQNSPQSPPRGGARRGPGIEALALDDHTGFEAIFDGKTLKGWDGDSTYWRVENGGIIGESTTEKPLKANTFLIWRGGQPKDFELKLEYRINSTNSGIQYRSVELPDVGKWVLKGYQADIDFQNTYTGQLYEERGREFLAMRGQMTLLQPGKKGKIADLRSGDELKGLIKVNDWNQFHIIARGNVLTHILNGYLMAEAIDDDAAGRAMSGLIGFQMHVGPPMKVEFRNIWLKNL